MLSAIAEELGVSIAGVKFPDSYQSILDGIRTLKNTLDEKEATIESLRERLEVDAHRGEEALSPAAHSHASSVVRAGFFPSRIALPTSASVVTGESIRSAGPVVSSDDAATLDADAFFSLEGGVEGLLSPVI